ncbi:collectin-10-like [Hydractinia symbiolongicarpus]|uniref:collectin-10-like n=1 Tax=Hydractinia symbiolongicarpus TaxID=13093 RepID=UPI00254E5673|nr:collectin-10-like [Hydractinia symbiolongicarpus]
MSKTLVLFITTLLCLFCYAWSNDILDKNQNNDFYAKNYKCPEGWQQRCEKCYLVVKEEKTWTDARYHCKQRGGDLVTIKDFATNMFLTRYVTSVSDSTRTIWIGLNDRVNEGEFQWADGSEAVKQEFRWYPDEPKDSTPGEDCVEMYVRSHQYLWNDAPCGDNLHFVCQIDGCVNGTQRCDNGKCVSKQKICDGVNDCGDNSDEKNCCKFYLKFLC